MAAPTNQPMMAPPIVRLQAFQAADVILAALQALFAEPKLIDDSSPFLFVPGQPQSSKVWVCDPESRQLTRDGNRMIVMVSRGEYQPQELHLMNRMEITSGGGGSNVRDLSDLGTTGVSIMCEGGNKSQSEALASISYSVLKYFRPQLMADYDIHSIRFLGIGPATHYPNNNPTPCWITTISLRIETQDHVRVTDIAEQLNKLNITAAVTKNITLKLAQLDGLGPATTLTESVSGANTGR
jgi:hypothetical protein